MTEQIEFDNEVSGYIALKNRLLTLEKSVEEKEQSILSNYSKFNIGSKIKVEEKEVITITGREYLDFNKRIKKESAEIKKREKDKGNFRKKTNKTIKVI